MENAIRFKQQCTGSHKLYCHYNILCKDQKIGEISFTRKREVFIIGYFKILEYHQGHHYGYQVIDYILSHSKVKCIVGQSLYSSRGFWNKCIHKFNGQRKNITTRDSCSSSFVIPRYQISKYRMADLLNIGCEIE